MTALRARDDGIAPALQLLIYPVTDSSKQYRSYEVYADGLFITREDMEWFGRQYLAGSKLDKRDPLVSPLLAADKSGLPPALFVLPGFDVLRDEGEAYAAAMRDAGVPVDLRLLPTLAHGFISMSAVGGGSAAALAEINSALRTHLGCR